jgi:two-component system, response regulator FlrC
MSSRKLLFIAQPQSVTRIFPALKEDGYEAGLAENLTGALGYVKKSSPELVFSRVRLPGYKAEDLLAEAAGREGFPPVIVFTDQGSAEEAQRLMELGAKDYWLEPLDWEKIQALIPVTLSHEARGGPAKPAAVGAAPSTEGLRIIGRHPAITRVLALARQVARSKATVLISGDSGTGKEMVARLLHNHSDRSDKPFVAVNCAALPEHLLESELFGHEKGAFTGAVQRKLGRFELADKGTILLDEISEMDLGLQAKLLRVLQEGELDRVGGTETVKVDVRVLATTNRNIQEWVDQGKFRQDLFFRLNVIPLKLPPLKERGEDMLELARFFVDKYCAEYGLPRLEFSEEAVSWLTGYDWPGNVRELQNLMERSVLLAGNGPIQKHHFLLDDESWPLLEEQAAAEAREAPQPGQSEEREHVARPLSGEDAENFLGGRVLPLLEMERIMIMRGLEHTSGNRTRAAELLGISVRTLRNKLNEYRSQGLEIP